MKKGYIFKLLVVVTMLFGLVACNQEEPVVDVSAIKGVPNKIVINYVDENTVSVKIDNNEAQEMTLEEFANLKVDATVVPENASDTSLKFESLAKDKFTISQDGEISFITSGSLKDKHFTASFKVTSNMNKSVTKTCVIEVNYEVPNADNTNPKKITLLNTTDALTSIDMFTKGGVAGNTFTPVIKVDEEVNMTNDYSELFTFTSSDSTVATVSEYGVVSPVSYGIATITVTSKLPYAAGKYASASFKVYVNAIKTYADLSEFLTTAAADYSSVVTKAEATKYEAFIAATDTDISGTADLAISGTKYLDLNGKSITTGKITIASGANLTVNGNTAKVSKDNNVGKIKTAAATLFDVSGTLDLNGGSYTVSNSGDTKVVNVASDSTFTVDNATLNATSTLGAAYGIYTSKDLIVGSNNKISATVESVETTAYGIYSSSSDGLTVGNGNEITVNATKDEIMDASTYGIWGSGDITVNNSIISVKNTAGYDSEPFASYAIYTTGKVTANSVTTTVTGRESYGIKAPSVEVTNGTWNIGEIDNGTAIAFDVAADSTITGATVTAKANTAYVVSSADNGSTATKVTVTNGAYTAEGSSFATAFNSTSENSTKPSLEFIGTPVIKAIATGNSGMACAVKTTTGVSVNANSTKVATFVAGGVNSLVFNLSTSTVASTIKNAKATAIGTNTATVVSAYYKGLVVDGGTYEAKNATNTAFAFEMVGIAGENTASIVVDKASATGTGTASAVKAITSDLIKIGGSFYSEGHLAYGIYAEDSNIKHGTNHQTAGILANTAIEAKGTGTDNTACGLYVKLTNGDSGKGKEINVDINTGLKVKATADKVSGVVFDNTHDYNSHLNVNWYGAEANVTAEGKSAAAALTNLYGQINFINDVSHSVFAGEFTAKVNSGVSLGLLNGFMNKQNITALKNGQTAVLEKAGIINVDGPAYFEFDAYATTGYDAKRQANYAGNFVGFESLLAYDKEAVSLQYSYPANGSELTYTSVALSEENSDQFNMKEYVKDDDPIVYQIPEGITWDSFVMNSWLSHKTYGIDKDTKKVYVLDKNCGSGNKVYVVSAKDGQAVLSTDTISNDTYFYGVPFKVEYIKKGVLTTDTYYSEITSTNTVATWKDYVANSFATFSLDGSSIVEGLVAGADKAHIWDNVTTGTKGYVAETTAIEYNRTYTLAIDYKIIDESIDSDGDADGVQPTKYSYTVIKGATWSDFVTGLATRVLSKPTTPTYAINGTDIIDSALKSTFVTTAVGDKVTRVKNIAEIIANTDYVVGMEFSIETVNAVNPLNKEVTTLYYDMKKGADWATFVDNFIGYTVDDSLEGKIVVGSLQGPEQAHVWDNTLVSSVAKGYVKDETVIEPGTTYYRAFDFAITDEKDAVKAAKVTFNYTVLEGTTWTDFVDEYLDAEETTETESNAPEYKLSTSDLTDTVVYKTDTDSSTFVTTAIGEKVTRVKNTELIVANTNYYVGMTFKIEAVDATDPENKEITTTPYDMKNGATWATFVTTFPGYAVDTTVKCLNQIVVSTTQGTNQAHVWDKTPVDPIAETKVAKGYVANTTVIEPGTIYVRALDFKITDKTTVENYIVLEGTTWADFASVAANVLKKPNDDFAYSLSTTNLLDTVVYKTDPNTFVTTAIGEKVTRVNKNALIIANTNYYVGMTFKIEAVNATDPENKEFTTTPYDMKNGATWATFVETFPGYRIDTIDAINKADEVYKIVVGSTQGLSQAHVWGPVYVTDKYTDQYVANNDEVGPGKTYYRAIDFKIFDEGKDVETPEASYTVLEGTTWNDFAQKKSAYILSGDKSVYKVATNGSEITARPKKVDTFLTTASGNKVTRVKNTELIVPNTDYYVGMTFTINSVTAVDAENKNITPTSYDMKNGATWQTFAVTFPGYTVDTVDKLDKKEYKIVVGTTQGPSQAHVWDTEEDEYVSQTTYITPGQEYVRAFDFTIYDGENDNAFTALEGTTWKNFAKKYDTYILDDDSSLDDFNVNKDGEIVSDLDKNIFIATASGNNVTRVSQDDSIVANTDYVLGMQFSIKAVKAIDPNNRTVDIQYYEMKVGATWATFVETFDGYDVDNKRIVVGDVKGPSQAHVWDNTEDAYVLKGTKIEPGVQYVRAIDFTITDGSDDPEEYTVLERTTWADFAGTDYAKFVLSPTTGAPEYVLSTTDLTDTVVYKTATDSSTFVTTASGNNVTRVNKNALIVANTNYYVGMEFSIETVNAVDPANKKKATQYYDMKNGATWATFVTTFPGYTVDDSFENTIVAGDISGPSQAHVWDNSKIEGASNVNGYVDDETTIIPGVTYVRAILFAIKDCNPNPEYFVVLEGTTWTDLCAKAEDDNDFILEYVGSSKYVASENKADVYMRTGASETDYEYYSIVTEDVSNNNKIAKVDKTKAIDAGVQYYTAVEFSVPYAETGKATVLNTYLMKRGSTWTDFAEKYNSLYAVDKDSALAVEVTAASGGNPAVYKYAIVNGSTYSGMKYMHIGKLNETNARAVDLVYSTEAIENGEYKLGVSADIKYWDSTKSAYTASVITALPETTWEEFANAGLSDSYEVMSSPDYNVSYAGNIIAEGNDDGTGLSDVKKGECITANKHYFQSVKFSIKLKSETKVCYAPNGNHLWNVFANGVDYLAVDNNCIAVSSTDGGAEKLHVCYVDATTGAIKFVTTSGDDSVIKNNGEYFVAYQIGIDYDYASEKWRYINVVYGSTISEDDVWNTVKLNSISSRPTDCTVRWYFNNGQEFIPGETIITEFDFICAKRFYSISYYTKINGVACDFVPKSDLPTEYEYGKGITIPDMTAGSSSYTFIGWTPCVFTTTDVSTGSSNYCIDASESGRKTLYAVYRTGTSGSYTYYCANTN